MRLVIAQMRHETNTFSPVATPLERFAKGGTRPPEGKEAYAVYKGTSSPIGAMIDVAEEAGAEFVIPVAAQAWPSGPAKDDVFEHIAGRVCEAVDKGCDAVFLDLHGAMVTESLDDGEGELLGRLRAIAPKVPIAVSLDMHANLSPAMVANATVIAGYQTYPHLDMYETGRRAGRILLDMLEGRTNPVMAWGSRPMLPHVMRQSSEDQPNRALQERCREIERGEALCASLFVGFPHADVQDAGLSAVVVSDSDEAGAQALCHELLEAAWERRADFVYAVEPLAQSLARAKAVTDGPVILLDHYDNAASGGTMDTMTVIAGMLDAGLENVAAFAVHDPWAVQEMIRAGVGAEVTLPLGGKLDMPAIGLEGRPLTVTGRVKVIFEGRFHNRGPMMRGILMDMGPTVVLDTGRVEIVVISRHQEPNDAGCFAAVGIEATEKRYIMLKSRVHWRAGFGPIAKAAVECAGTGVCTSDYGTLDFRKLRRPIYPLDPEAAPGDRWP